MLPVEEGQSRAQGCPLCPPDLQNQRFHLGLALGQSFEVIVQKQDLSWLQFLNGVQPAKIDERISNEYDEPHAVRSGDKLCP